MLRAKLTSKGQITIPVTVRHKLNLQPGDELLFEFDRDDEVKLRTLKHKRLTELYASLPVKRPFPNKEQVREEVAAEMARRMLAWLYHQERKSDSRALTKFLCRLLILLVTIYITSGRAGFQYFKTHQRIGKFVNM